jgi:hypothetical protein
MSRSVFESQSVASMVALICEVHLQDEQKRRGISASCEHYCMSMRDGSGVHLQLSRLGLASLESGGLARGGFGLLFQRALRRRELLGRLLRLRLPRLLGLGVLNLNLDLDLDLDLNVDGFKVAREQNAEHTKTTPSTKRGRRTSSSSFSRSRSASANASSSSFLMRRCAAPPQPNHHDTTQITESHAARASRVPRNQRLTTSSSSSNSKTHRLHALERLLAHAIFLRLLPLLQLAPGQRLRTSYCRAVHAML